MAEGDVDWSGVLIIINGEMPAHCLAASAGLCISRCWLFLVVTPSSPPLLNWLTTVQIKELFLGREKSGRRKKGPARSYLTRPTFSSWDSSLLLVPPLDPARVDSAEMVTRPTRWKSTRQLFPSKTINAGRERVKCRYAPRSVQSKSFTWSFGRFYSCNFQSPGRGRCTNKRIKSIGKSHLVDYLLLAAHHHRSHSLDESSDQKHFGFFFFITFSSFGWHLFLLSSSPSAKFNWNDYFSPVKFVATSWQLAVH